MKYFVLIFILSGTSLLGQTKSNDGIAKGLNLFIYPTEKQDVKTQDADEIDCYKWAKSQTGVDPLNFVEIVPEKVDKKADGSGIRGAAGGAAAGAAIGAISRRGDAGRGAAIGAILGGIKGRKEKKYRDAAKQQQSEAAAAAMEEELMNNFKKAFSVCMEGKRYTVK